MKKKKLYNIKCNDTSMILFGPICTNNMGEVDVCVNSRVLSNTTKLIKVQKTICRHMKLKAITDDFFNKFAHHIEEYYRIEQFGDIIQVFIGLGYNN